MQRQKILHITIFCTALIVINSCKTLDQIAASRDVNKHLKTSHVFSQQFTGFVLYDPVEGKYLKDYNGDKYFTPASNTKILSAAACLSSFGDSIPSFQLKYVLDTAYIRPYGDPTFLHPDFPNQPVLSKLRQKHLKVILGYPVESFGPGWAWDDYQYDFQNERAEMPIYGNMVRLTIKDSLMTSPNFFEGYVTHYTDEISPNFRYRDPSLNIFNVWKVRDSSQMIKDIPFKYSEELLVRLLRDTLGIPVTVIPNQKVSGTKIVYNSSTLSAVSLMMQRSDNFLAEQLLIVSGKVMGYENTDAYRRSLISKWQLPQATQWVDGSGLSRYNLITPKSLVKVLNDLYQSNKWQTITTIFPTGGVSGTIRQWYAADQPYVFAKTGTLSNNHSLSGYLKTKSGKTLIFSFMNNNYTCSVSEVKKEMQVILEAIRDGY